MVLGTYFICQLMLSRALFTVQSDKAVEESGEKWEGGGRWSEWSQGSYTVRPVL